MTQLAHVIDQTYEENYEPNSTRGILWSAHAAPCSPLVKPGVTHTIGYPNSLIKYSKLFTLSISYHGRVAKQRDDDLMWAAVILWSYIDNRYMQLRNKQTVGLRNGKVWYSKMKFWIVEETNYQHSARWVDALTM